VLQICSFSSDFEHPCEEVLFFNDDNNEGINYSHQMLHCILHFATLTLTLAIAIALALALAL
jgi:hypothetical protein